MDNYIYIYNKIYYLKPLACHSSWTDHVRALGQVSGTALCYSTVLF